MIYSFLSGSTIRSNSSRIYSDRVPLLVFVTKLFFTSMGTFSIHLICFLLPSSNYSSEWNLPAFRSSNSNRWHYRGKKKNFEGSLKNESLQNDFCRQNRFQRFPIERATFSSLKASQRPSTDRIHLKCHLQTKFFQSHSKVFDLRCFMWS